MRIEEAKWIADQLKNIDASSKVLNIGSSTKQFRQEIQPHIDKLVFNSLSERHIQVVHCDIKKDEGVNLIGDIMEKEFADKVKDMNFNVVICSNVLEHIDNLSHFCNSLEYILSTGSRLFITVPNIYPFHKDLIDTKFRPNIEEVAVLFPGCVVIEGVILRSYESHFVTLIKNPYTLLLTLKNWLIPRFGIEEWKKRCSDIPNLFKKYRMTCIVFQKK